MSFALTNLVVISPELFVAGMICLMILLTACRPNTRINYFLTQLTLFVTAILSINLFSQPTTVAFSDMFILDKLASFCKAVTAVMTAFAFLYARNYNRERQIAENEYHILGLFAFLGMMVMVSAYSLLTLFLGVELLSLPLYAMAAMWRSSGNASEASMKYFVMGSLASGLFLYGLSLLYGATGSLIINQIAINLTHNSYHLVLCFGLVFLLVALAFKLGAAPFHLWAPDVYQGAPTGTVLFLSAAPKIAVFVVVSRLLNNALPMLHYDWQQLLIVIAVLSMSLGNLIAIAQNSLKRMLAYSAVAHMGYMLLGVIAGTPQGYGSALFYIVSYALMSLGAIAVLVLLSQKGVEIEAFEDLHGLNERNPWLAFMLLLVMFSMAGIPPTIGFFAKLGVLEALIHQNLIWLATVALVFAIIGAYYYLRVVKMMYFDEPDNKDIIIINNDLYAAITINGLLVFVLGIFPNALIEICRQVFA